MTTQQRAVEAWSQMIRERTVFDTFTGVHPMTAGIALDYVQDGGCEREESLRLLCAAGAINWLFTALPTKSSEIGRQCSSEALYLIDTLASGNYEQADVLLRPIRNRLAFPDGTELGEWENWRQWSVKAAKAIMLIAELEAAK